MNEYLTDEYLYRQIEIFLDTHKLLDKPKDIFSICEEEGWSIIPYNNEIEDIMKISSESFTYYQNNDYFIFYNTDMDPYQIKFEIAHQVGHIVLNHLHISDTPLTKYLELSNYEDWDRHAHTFAYNILMPAKVIVDKRIRSSAEICKYFNMSKKLSEERLKLLDKDLHWLV